MTIFTPDMKELPSLHWKALSVNVKEHVADWIARLSEGYYPSAPSYMTVDAAALRLVLGVLKSTEEAFATSTGRMSTMTLEYNKLKDGYNKLMHDFTDRGTELNKAGGQIVELKEYNNNQFEIIIGQQGEVSQLRADNADLLTRLHGVENARDGYMRGYNDRGDQIVALKKEIEELKSNQDFDLTTINSLQDQLNTYIDAETDAALKASAPSPTSLELSLAETVKEAVGLLRIQADTIASLAKPKQEVYGLPSFA